MPSDSTKPFEIRRDLLNLAKDILSENMHVSMDFADRNKKPLKDTPRYTTEDVLREAEKLYAFVSKR